MKVRAGSLPPLELHRVQEEQIDSMPIQYADDEPIDWASFRPLVIAGLVMCIVGLFYWGFV